MTKDFFALAANHEWLRSVYGFMNSLESHLLKYQVLKYLKYLGVIALSTALLGGIFIFGARMEPLTGWLSGAKENAVAQPEAEPDVANLVALPVQAEERPVLAPRGNVYYVSPRGSDGARGDVLTPWRTIQYAINQARAGDTIYVRGGTYYEGVHLQQSGTRDAPITLARYQNESVILDGKGSAERDGFTVDGNFIIIDGFKVQNRRNSQSEGFGFVIWQDANDIVLRNMEFHALGAPIKVAAAGGAEKRSRITIENVTAWDYKSAGIDLGPGAVEDIVIRNVQLFGPETGNETGVDGLSVENGNRVLLEDVTVRGHAGDGVDLKASNATLRRVDVRGHGRNGIKVWDTPALIEHCRIADSRTGLGALILGGGGPLIVRHNVVLNTGGAERTMNSYSVEIGKDENPNNPVTLLSLYGNTFHAVDNNGVLIRFYPNIRLQPDSDYNTYFSPRTSTVIAGATDTRGKLIEIVTPDDINQGVWAKNVQAETHSRFSPETPPAPAEKTRPKSE